MPIESHISEGAKALGQQGRIGTRNDPVKATNPFLYGRVVNIVLSENDALYAQYKVLDVIQFESVQDIGILDKSGDKEKNYLIAYKLHSTIKTPLINEIVPIFNAPDILVQQSSNQFSEAFYYSDPISLYNSVEHNAAPDENTLQNIDSNRSSNRASSYQSTTNGLSNNTPGTDTILSKQQVKLGEYFKENGVKQLTPLEGDHRVEGRFGNSIRFGGTPSAKISNDMTWKGSNVGSPVIIIRNNQGKVESKVNSLFEDINKDGSSVYMLSDQTIEFTLASNNFDSYHQTNDNSQVKSQVIMGSPVKQGVNQSAVNTDVTKTPSETINYPVASNSLQASDTPSPVLSDNIPDNEDDINFVQIGDDIPVPVTQGVVLNAFNSNYKFVESVNPSSQTNTTVKRAHTVSLSSVNAINSFAGQVNSVPTISKNGKALLDLLALTEGTIGQGSFNGYDIIVRGGLIPGFDTVNSAPPHPNIKVFISEYNIYSSAAGRYQFVINTWNTVAGKGTVMSRYNQDYACWKNILNSANVPSILINKIDLDFDSFKKVVGMMATQWASLPIENDPKGLYKQAGRFSFETLYTYFKQILAKY